MDEIALVERFIQACSANDVDRVVSMVSDDCVYHNIPVAPVTGPAAIRAVLSSFMSAADAAEWIVHQIAVSPSGCVLTERTDRFRVGGTWIELPVMGAFEVRDGRIRAWRDYFDMAQFQKQMAAARPGPP